MKSELIKNAVDVLRSGGVIIYPTETLYGLGVDATNEIAVNKVFELKKRDKKKPILVAFHRVDEAKKYVKWNEYADVLAKKFLPGPLSIILEVKENIFPVGIVSDENKVGIRIPDHELVLDIISEFGKPITSTSANISGGISPWKVEYIPKEIKEGVELIIDTGECEFKKGSTLVDVSGRYPIILREDTIPREKIFDVLDGVAGI